MGDGIMQVNTNSVSLLHKAILETELHRLPPHINVSLPPIWDKNVIVREWLEKRIEELSKGKSV